MLQLLADILALVIKVSNQIRYSNMYIALARRQRFTECSDKIYYTCRYRK